MLYKYLFYIEKGFIYKRYSHSPCPQNNCHNFSLESPTIFLSVSFSYTCNYHY